MNLVQQTLNSDNFVWDIYTKEMNDDTDDDLKIIKINDMLKKTV